MGKKNSNVLVSLSLIILLDTRYKKTSLVKLILVS